MQPDVAFPALPVSSHGAAYSLWQAVFVAHPSRSASPKQIYPGCGTPVGILREEHLLAQLIQYWQLCILTEKIAKKEWQIPARHMKALFSYCEDSVLGGIIPGGDHNQVRSQSAELRDISAF